MSLVTSNSLLSPVANVVSLAGGLVFGGLFDLLPTSLSAEVLAYVAASF